MAFASSEAFDKLSTQRYDRGIIKMSLWFTANPVSARVHDIKFEHCTIDVMCN